MISTEELKSWRSSIASSKIEAEERAIKNSHNEEMSRYYLRLADIYRQHFYLIERLILDSTEHDIKGE